MDRVLVSRLYAAGIGVAIPVAGALWRWRKTASRVRRHRSPALAPFRTVDVGRRQAGGMALARRRTICVMGRPLDQDDGIGIYTSQLLRNMLTLDPTSRYVILLRSAKHAHLFDE